MNLEVITTNEGQGLINANTKEVLLEASYKSIKFLNDGRYIVAYTLDTDITNVSAIIFDKNLTVIAQLTQAYWVQDLSEKYLLVDKNTGCGLRTLIFNVETCEYEYTLEIGTRAYLNSGKQVVLHGKETKEDEFSMIIFDIRHDKLKLIDKTPILYIDTLCDRQSVCYIVKENENKLREFHLVYFKDGDVKISDPFDAVVKFDNKFNRVLIKNENTAYILDYELNLLNTVEDIADVLDIKTRFHNFCAMTTINNDHCVYSCENDTLTKMSLQSYCNNVGIVKEANSEVLYDLRKGRSISGRYDSIELLTLDYLETLLDSEEFGYSDHYFEIEECIEEWIGYSLYKARRGDYLYVIAIDDSTDTSKAKEIYKVLDSNNSKNVHLLPLNRFGVILLEDERSLYPVLNIEEPYEIFGGYVIDKGINNSKENTFFVFEGCEFYVAKYNNGSSLLTVNKDDHITAKNLLDIYEGLLNFFS